MQHKIISIKRDTLIPYAGNSRIHSEEDLGSFDIDEGEMPDLASGEKSPFQQKTFSLADAQAKMVDMAIEKAKEMGHGKSSLNENSNGNALSFICQSFNQIT